jgi:hypothetical protein
MANQLRWIAKGQRYATWQFIGCVQAWNTIVQIAIHLRTHDARLQVLAPPTEAASKPADGEIELPHP